MKVEDEKVNEVFTFPGVFNEKELQIVVSEPGLAALKHRLLEKKYRSKFIDFHRIKKSNLEIKSTIIALEHIKNLELIEVVRAFEDFKNKSDNWLKNIKGFQTILNKYNQAVQECFQACSSKQPDQRQVDEKYLEVYKILSEIINTCNNHSNAESLVRFNSKFTNRSNAEDLERLNSKFASFFDRIKKALFHQHHQIASPVRFFIISVSVVLV